MGPLNRGWIGGNSRNFFVEVETHLPKACVSAVEKAEESGVWLQRWKLSNCFVEVGTHCPKACVSAVGKAEKAR